jgi:hypothetical protein
MFSKIADGKSGNPFMWDTPYLWGTKKLKIIKQKTVYIKI